MEFLTALWLPILLSAVFVFVASSFLHMVLPLHKGDYARIPNEDAVRDGLRPHGLAPGQYMFPSAASMKEMGSPEMIAKMEEGPVGLLTILPNGPMNMGRLLLQWFLFSVVVSVFCGYLGYVALGPGAHYLAAFRFTGTVAVLAYAVSHVPDSIWKGLSWATTARFVFDGVVYGLVTAGTFGWLWPSA